MGFLRSRRRVRFEADLEALRIRIAAATRERVAQTVGLVGLRPGAGVTTLALCLARASAREGCSVLLVDANRVAPRIHAAFGLPASPGVEEVLRGTVPPEGTPRRIEGVSLSVLPCGQARDDVTPSPDRWRDLFARLRVDGGRVFVDAGAIDTPSAVAVAAAVDAAVLVVEAGRSQWEAVADSVRRLSEHGVALLGVVLNKRRYPIPEFVYRRF